MHSKERVDPTPMIVTAALPVLTIRDTTPDDSPVADVPIFDKTEEILRIKYKVQRGLNRVHNENPIPDNEKITALIQILSEINGVLAETIRVTPLQLSSDLCEDHWVNAEDGERYGWNCKLEFAKDGKSFFVDFAVVNPSIDRKLPERFRNPFLDGPPSALNCQNGRWPTDQEASSFFDAVIQCGGINKTFRDLTVRQLEEVDTWFWAKTFGGSTSLDSFQKFREIENRWLLSSIIHWNTKIKIPDDNIEQLLFGLFKSETDRQLDMLLEELDCEGRPVWVLAAASSRYIQSVLELTKTEHPNWNFQDVHRYVESLDEYIAYLTDDTSKEISGQNPFFCYQIANGILENIISTVELYADALEVPFNAADIRLRNQRKLMEGGQVGKAPSLDTLLTNIFSEPSVKRVCQELEGSAEPISGPSDARELNKLVELKHSVEAVKKTLGKIRTPREIEAHKSILQDQLFKILSGTVVLEHVDAPWKHTTIYQLDGFLTLDHTNRRFDEFIIHRISSITNRIAAALKDIPNRKRAVGTPPRLDENNSDTTLTSPLEFTPVERLTIRHTIQKALHQQNRQAPMTEMEQIRTVTKMLSQQEGVVRGTITCTPLTLPEGHTSPVVEQNGSPVWRFEYVLQKEDRGFPDVCDIVNPAVARQLPMAFRNYFTVVPGTALKGRRGEWPHGDTISQFFACVFNSAGAGGPLRATAINELKTTDPWFWARSPGGGRNDLTHYNKHILGLHQHLYESFYTWMLKIPVPKKASDLNPFLEWCNKSQDAMRTALKPQDPQHPINFYIDKALAQIDIALKEKADLGLAGDISEVREYITTLQEYQAYLTDEPVIDLSFNNPYCASRIRNGILCFLLAGIDTHAEVYNIDFNYDQTLKKLQNQLIVKNTPDSVPDLKHLIHGIFNDPDVRNVTRVLDEKRRKVSSPANVDAYNSLVDLKQAAQSLAKSLDKVTTQEANADQKAAIENNLFKVLTSLTSANGAKVSWREETLTLIDAFLVSDHTESVFDEFVLFRIRAINNSILDALSEIGSRKKAVQVHSAPKVQQPFIPEPITLADESPPPAPDETTTKVERPLTDRELIEQSIIEFIKLPYNKSLLDKQRAETVKKIESLTASFSGSPESIDAEVGLVFVQAEKGYFERDGETVRFALGQKGAPHSLSIQQAKNLSTLKDAYLFREGTELGKQRALDLETEKANKARELANALARDRVNQAHTAAIARQLKEKADDEEWQQMLLEEAEENAEQEQKQAAEVEAERIAQEARENAAKENVTKMLIDGGLSQDDAQEIVEGDIRLTLTLNNLPGIKVSVAVRKISNVVSHTHTKKAIQNVPSLLPDIADNNIPDAVLRTHKTKILDGTFGNDQKDQIDESPTYRKERIGEQTAQAKVERVRTAFATLPEDVKTAVHLACLVNGDQFTTRFMKLEDRSELIRVVQYAKGHLGFDNTQIAKLLGKAPKLMDPPQDGEQNFVEFIEDDLKVAFNALGLTTDDIPEFVLAFPRAFHPDIVERAGNLADFYVEKVKGVTTADIALAVKKHKEMILYGDTLYTRLERLEKNSKKYDAQLTRDEILKTYPNLLGFVNLKSKEGEVSRDEIIFGILSKAARNRKETLEAEHLDLGSHLNPFVTKATIERDLDLLPLKTVLEAADTLQRAVRVRHSPSGKLRHIFHIINEQVSATRMTSLQLVEYLRTFDIDEQDGDQPTITEWMAALKADEERSSLDEFEQFDGANA